MNLTRRQKALLVVFLVGLAGLVVDRTILLPQGGPSAARAESDPLKPAALGARAPVAEPPPGRAPLAQRLDALLPDGRAGSGKVRDPFSLPASWSDDGDAGQEADPDDVGAFARRHQLRAVVIQGDGIGAQVDDTFVVPGQSFDGFRLVSVGLRCAVFERDGRQVALDLVLK
jgi:hypothetical protein